MYDSIHDAIVDHNTELSHAKSMDLGVTHADLQSLLRDEFQHISRADPRMLIPPHNACIDPSQIRRQPRKRVGLSLVGDDVVLTSASMAKGHARTRTSVLAGATIVYSNATEGKDSPARITSEEDLNAVMSNALSARNRKEMEEFFRSVQAIRSGSPRQRYLRMLEEERERDRVSKKCRARNLDSKIVQYLRKEMGCRERVEILEEEESESKEKSSWHRSAAAPATTKTVAAEREDAAVRLETPSFGGAVRSRREFKFS